MAIETIPCPDCGKPLEKLGDLEDHEFHDWLLMNEKMNAANQAFDLQTTDISKFNDQQTFEYFRAAGAIMAEARFLDYCLARKLKERLGVSQDTRIKVMESGVYKHPD